MSWSPGADRIRELVDADQIERVQASTDVAYRLVDDAGRHIDSAQAIVVSGDLTGAYQLAYDAMRKAAASLLAVQGLRATSRGGHIAVQDAVNAQFGDTVRAFRAFGRLRRNRNRFECPGDTASMPQQDDVDDALAVATEILSKARAILDSGVLDSW